MALSRGLSRAIAASCASSSSSGLSSRARMRATSSQADFRVRASSAMASLAGPVHEPALDQQEQEIEAIAERTGGKDRRIHVGHGKQLLGFEHALAEAVGRADEHLGDDDD